MEIIYSIALTLLSIFIGYKLGDYQDKKYHTSSKMYQYHLNNKSKLFWKYGTYECKRREGLTDVKNDARKNIITGKVQVKENKVSKFTSRGYDFKYFQWNTIPKWNNYKFKLKA
tara:strand:- start:6374 stop:6715 length:342 start_codon:yes stop_codon:yes gene_type:complete